MSTDSTHRSILLVLLHGFLSIGAIGGGLLFIISPSGELMGLSASLLDDSPFPSYFIPGLILLLVLGILPAIVAVALIKQWAWTWAEALNIFKDRHWSWTFSLYIGFILIIWIVAQVAIIKELSVLQLIFIVWGMVIQIVTLLPSTQRKYSR